MTRSELIRHFAHLRRGSAEEPITKAQVKVLAMLFFGHLGFTGGPEDDQRRYGVLADIFNIDVGSFYDLTKAQASELIIAAYAPGYFSELDFQARKNLTPVWLPQPEFLQMVTELIEERDRYVTYFGKDEGDNLSPLSGEEVPF